MKQKKLSALDISLTVKRVGSWKLFPEKNREGRRKKLPVSDLFGAALKEHYIVFAALTLLL